jgi:hypothetical protein
LKSAEQPPHEIRENLSQSPEISQDSNTDTVLSGPDIQSIKVSIHTTTTFIEAAWIITQIELHIVGLHMKSTEVDLGNNIEKSKGSRRKER